MNDVVEAGNVTYPSAKRTRRPLAFSVSFLLTTQVFVAHLNLYVRMYV